MTVVKRIVKKLFYLVFIIVISSCKNLRKPQVEPINTIGYNLLMSDYIEKYYDEQINGGIILYVEYHTCCSCLEKIIHPLYCLLEDSLSNIYPLLIIHSSVKDSDRTILSKQYNSRFQVVLTSLDSIRNYNGWIPRGLVYYGFILDSNGCIEASGFISNKTFVENCYLYCKEKQQ